MPFTSSLRSFPNAVFQTIPMLVWLMMALPCLFQGWSCERLNLVQLKQKDFCNFDPKAIRTKVLCLDFVGRALWHLVVAIQTWSGQGDLIVTLIGWCFTLWGSHVPFWLHPDSAPYSDPAGKLRGMPSFLDEHERHVGPMYFGLCMQNIPVQLEMNCRHSPSCFGKSNGYSPLHHNRGKLRHRDWKEGLKPTCAMPLVCMMEACMWRLMRSSTAFGPVTTPTLALVRCIEVINCLIYQLSPAINRVIQSTKHESQIL